MHTTTKLTNSSYLGVKSSVNLVKEIERRGVAALKKVQGKQSARIVSVPSQRMLGHDVHAMAEYVGGPQGYCLLGHRHTLCAHKSDTQIW